MYSRQFDELAKEIKEIKELYSRDNFPALKSRQLDGLILEKLDKDIKNIEAKLLEHESFILKLSIDKKECCRTCEHLDKNPKKKLVDLRAKYRCEKQKLDLRDEHLETKCSNYFGKTSGIIKLKEKVTVLEEAFIVTNELLLRQATVNTDLCARVVLLEKKVKKLENKK